MAGDALETLRQRFEGLWVYRDAAGYHVAGDASLCRDDALVVWRLDRECVPPEVAGLIQVETSDAEDRKVEETNHVPLLPHTTEALEAVMKPLLIVHHPQKWFQLQRVSYASLPPLQFEQDTPMCEIAQQQPAIPRLPILQAFEPKFKWLGGMEALVRGRDRAFDFSQGRKRSWVSHPNRESLGRHCHARFVVEFDSLKFEHGVNEIHHVEVALYRITSNSFNRISDTFSMHVNADGTLGNQAKRCMFDVYGKLDGAHLVVKVYRVLQGDLRSAFDLFGTAPKGRDAQKQLKKEQQRSDEYSSHPKRYMQLFAIASSPLLAPSSHGKEQLHCKGIKLDQFYAAPTNTSLGIYFCDSLYSNAFRPTKWLPGQLLCQAFTVSTDRNLALAALKKEGYTVSRAMNGKHVHECSNREETTWPLQEATHLLYCQPRKIALPDFRNLVVSVALRREDTRLHSQGEKCIYPMNSVLGFHREAVSSVKYQTKNPSFEDEFKLQLPLNLTSSDHLFFTFYNVTMKDDKGKRSPPVEDVVGYSILPLVSDQRFIDPECEMRVFSKLPESNYLLELVQPHAKHLYDPSQYYFSCAFDLKSCFATSDVCLTRFIQCARYSVSVMSHLSDESCNDPIVLQPEQNQERQDVIGEMLLGLYCSSFVEVRIQGGKWSARWAIVSPDRIKILRSLLSTSPEDELFIDPSDLMVSLREDGNKRLAVVLRSSKFNDFFQIRHRNTTVSGPTQFSELDIFSSSAEAAQSIAFRCRSNALTMQLYNAVRHIQMRDWGTIASLESLFGASAQSLIQNTYRIFQRLASILCTGKSRIVDATALRFYDSTCSSRSVAEYEMNLEFYTQRCRLSAFTALLALLAKIDSCATQRYGRLNRTAAILLHLGFHYHDVSDELHNESTTPHRSIEEAICIQWLILLRNKGIEELHPSYRRSITHSDVLIEIILKSLGVRSQQSDDPPRTSLAFSNSLMSALQELIHALVHEIRFLHDSGKSGGCMKLNFNTALLLRDLLYLLPCDIVFSYLAIYITTLRDACPEEMFNGLQTICEHEHLIALSSKQKQSEALTNFLREYAPSQAVFTFGFSNTFQSPFQSKNKAIKRFNALTAGSLLKKKRLSLSFIPIMLANEVTHALDRGSGTTAACQCLREVFTKLDYDARYTSAQKRNQIALPYLPLVCFSSERIDKIAALPLADRRDLLFCVLFVLRCARCQDAGSFLVQYGQSTAFLKQEKDFMDVVFHLGSQLVRLCLLISSDCEDGSPRPPPTDGVISKKQPFHPKNPMGLFVAEWPLDYDRMQSFHWDALYDYPPEERPPMISIPQHADSDSVDLQRYFAHEATATALATIESSIIPMLKRYSSHTNTPAAASLRDDILLFLIRCIARHQSIDLTVHTIRVLQQWYGNQGASLFSYALKVGDALQAQCWFALLKKATSKVAEIRKAAHECMCAIMTSCYTVAGSLSRVEDAFLWSCSELAFHYAQIPKHGLHSQLMHMLAKLKHNLTSMPHLCHLVQRAESLAEIQLVSYTLSLTGRLYENKHNTIARFMSLLQSKTLSVRMRIRVLRDLRDFHLRCRAFYPAAQASLSLVLLMRSLIGFDGDTMDRSFYLTEKATVAYFKRAHVSCATLFGRTKSTGTLLALRVHEMLQQFLYWEIRHGPSCSADTYSEMLAVQRRLMQSRQALAAAKDGTGDALFYVFARVLVKEMRQEFIYRRMVDEPMSDLEIELQEEFGSRLGVEPIQCTETEESIPSQSCIQLARVSVHHSQGSAPLNPMMGPRAFLLRTLVDLEGVPGRRDTRVLERHVLLRTASFTHLACRAPVECSTLLQRE